MKNKRLREFLDTIKKVNLSYSLAKRDIDEYTEEKDYKIVFNELKKKFDIPYDFDTLFYSSNDVYIDDLNKYYNYLLSLNKDIYNEYVWNDLDLSDDKYSGKAQKMYYRKMRAYNKWAHKHNNFNHTKEESDGIISIHPLKYRESHMILNTLFRHKEKEEIDSGLWYGIQFPNTIEDHFYSIIVDKKIVGVVGLQKIREFYTRSNTIYSISYYIIPEYRNNHYATNAVRLLIDMAFNNRIIIDQLDKKYDYILHRIPLDVRMIYSIINDNNEYSKKVTLNNNFKLIGNYKNIDIDSKEELWNWYMVERSQYAKKRN